MNETFCCWCGMMEGHRTLQYLRLTMVQAKGMLDVLQLEPGTYQQNFDALCQLITSFGEQLYYAGQTTEDKT